MKNFNYSFWKNKSTSDIVECVHMVLLSFSCGLLLFPIFVD